MMFKSILIGALAVSVTSHDDARPMCQMPKLSLAKIESSRQEMAAYSDIVASFADEIIQVDTYFHVVAESKTVAGGNISRDLVLAQFNQLNKDFTNTCFNLTLKDIDWTVNAKWYNQCDNLQMKKKLRKGSYMALNLYIYDCHGGYCEYPSNAKPGSEDYILDGCGIGPYTLPGSDNSLYNRGKLATHEFGHWFNLIHPYETECSEPSDEVDDTPTEKKAANTQGNGCPIGRDSCPGRPGPDPIHNFMKSTSDDCRTEFTPGQINRMKMAWATYRQGK